MYYMYVLFIYKYKTIELKINEIGKNNFIDLFFSFIFFLVFFLNKNNHNKLGINII